MKISFKKTFIILAIALPTQTFALEVFNGVILDHTTKIIKGTGTEFVKLIPPNLKSPKDSYCFAMIGMLNGYVNQPISIQGDFTYHISNRQETSQNYEVFTKVGLDDGREKDDTWHIKVEPHGFIANALVETLTTTYSTPGLRHTYADIYVRGLDGCEDHNRSTITIYNP